MKILILFSTFVFAFSANANFESYDEIVTKLTRYQKDEIKQKTGNRPEVRTYSMAHLGLGVSQTFYDADATGLDSRMQNQGGLIINVGVDVLSRKWGLEGSFSNFGTANTDNTQIKLREFSLKGLYKPTINKTWSLRMGMGVSSRFLDITNEATSESYRTPSGLFLFGIDSYLSNLISVGADVNFKTAMISDTIDQNSVDLTFRVDTHF